MRLQLTTRVPPARRFYIATLSTRLPAIGEPMIAVGFVAEAAVFKQRLADTMELQAGLRMTSGPVLRHFPYRRDSVVARWPCLEIDAPLYGGMSGGAVFDARGFLIGLGARSPNLGPDEEPSPMVAGLIWPGLGQRFAVGDDPRGPMTSLLEMAGRYAFIERPEVVTIGPAENGWVTNYTPWT
jgi:Trypsin-like peptidase domain